LGASQRSAVGSYLMRIIQHLVKLEYSPPAEPRSGWRRTIRLARLQVQKRVEDNPSLKPELGSLIEGETRRGIEYAIADLEEHGEIDDVDAQVLRRAQYTETQILSDWFPRKCRIEGQERRRWDRTSPDKSAMGRTDVTSIYDLDFVGWTEQQAEALRTAARGGSNQVVDWQNLAEEIEGLGSRKDRLGEPDSAYYSTFAEAGVLPCERAATGAGGFDRGRQDRDGGSAGTQPQS
jgi:Domain of unknown function DUF29